ncbi:MAG: Rieske (2Fe-2S) protein [Gammaproteobacteria bacterium]
MTTQIQDSASRTQRTIRVGTHEDLKSRGVIVVSGEKRRIAVFAEGDALYAVENNCPHMGFPLDRGTVRDGMLTCHWHQARFDLRTGCTFDLWADDVPRYECWLEDDVVFVAPNPVSTPDEQVHRQRLRRGIEQNVGLVQAKSLLALLEGGASLDSITEEVVDYAQRNLNTYTEGMIRLGCIVTTATAQSERSSPASASSRTRRSPISSFAARVSASMPTAVICSRTATRLSSCWISSERNVRARSFLYSCRVSWKHGAAKRARIGIIQSRS